LPRPYCHEALSFVTLPLAGCASAALAAEVAQPACGFHDCLGHTGFDRLQRRRYLRWWHQRRCGQPACICATGRATTGSGRWRRHGSSASRRGQRARRWRIQIAGPCQGLSKSLVPLSAAQHLGACPVCAWPFFKGFRFDQISHFTNFLRPSQCTPLGQGCELCRRRRVQCAPAHERRQRT
jgi:hypothetical protein